MFAVKLDGVDKELQGGDIKQCTVWTDLTPVPVTVEVILSGGVLKDATDTKKKRFMQIGDYEFEVLLPETTPTDQTYGDAMGTSLKLTGFIKQCAKIGYTTERPVILENSSFGAAYRACGADCRITKDVPLERFYCYRGRVPSLLLMPVFQREACLPRWKDGGLGVWRLSELAAQKPVTSLKNIKKEESDSEFLRRHFIPSYYSYDDAGQIVYSNRFEGRSLQYLPRASQRVVNNMTTVLIFKFSITADIAPDVNAGDVVEIEGEKYIIMTAAHQEGQDTEEMSRFWLGVVQ